MYGHFIWDIEVFLEDRFYCSINHVNIIIYIDLYYIIHYDTISLLTLLLHSLSLIIPINA